MIQDFPSTPRDQNYRAAHREATRQMLLDHVRTQPQSARRLTIAAAAGAGVILIGTSTAVAYELASSAPVTDKNTARCYATVSSDFGNDFPGVTVAAAGNSQSGTPGAVTAPVSLCRYLWSTGTMSPVHTRGATPSLSPRNANQVPPLIGCVLPDGTAGVFPGTEQTCQALGLPVAQSG
jgi:hypothetical protein